MIIKPNTYLCRECMAVEGIFSFICSYYGKCNRCNQIKAIEKIPDYFITRVAYRKIIGRIPNEK